MTDRTRRAVSWGFLLAGLALLVLYFGARIQGEVARRVDLARFERVRVAQTAVTGASGNSVADVPAPGVDQGLWSEGRIAAYRESLGHPVDPPLAVLRISRIGLEVPVLEGTGELVLNRAVGHIPGTALPGQPGNIALAGHRDGFFRGLKDLELGDRLELETIAGKQEFAVRDLSVVDPTAVHVLDPTSSPNLTLVTCYPFYFVGKAPKRYIVRASLIGPPASPTSETGAADDGQP